MHKKLGDFQLEDQMLDKYLPFTQPAFTELGLCHTNKETSSPRDRLLDLNVLL